MQLLSVFVVFKIVAIIPRDIQQLSFNACYTNINVVSIITDRPMARFPLQERVARKPFGKHQNLFT